STTWKLCDREIFDISNIDINASDFIIVMNIILLIVCVALRSVA
ncbi:MAG: hypothetical protein ACI90V_013098, partial [Bacillariaceae sp.]